MKNLLMCAAVAATAGAASASTVTVLDSANEYTTNGWSTLGSGGAGVAAITGARPRSGNGSLELRTNGMGDKAAASFGSNRFAPGPVLGTLGQLAAGSISFDFLVDSSTTTAGFRAPALEFAVRTADNSQGVTLKWEAAYNGYPSNGPGVPTDTWITVDATAGNSGCSARSAAVEQFGVTLGTGSTAPTSAATPSSARRQHHRRHLHPGRFGLGRSFLGYADNLNVSFADGATYSANFELEGPSSRLLAGHGRRRAHARRRLRRRR